MFAFDLCQITFSLRNTFTNLLDNNYTSQVYLSAIKLARVIEPDA